MTSLTSDVERSVDLRCDLELRVANVLREKKKRWKGGIFAPGTTFFLVLSSYS